MRLAEGAPPTDDAFKPIGMADYKPAMTAERFAELKAVFPESVCDYSKPGVGQARLAGAWVSLNGNGDFTALEPSR
jgi:Tannase-like family of unknown function (DUF6351)